MRVITYVVVAAGLLCGVFALSAREHADERLRGITSVFVSGNNQAAEGARAEIGKGKTCFALATKTAEADAVVDISAESQSQGGEFGSLGGREWIASATVTLKSGDLIWSRSERFGDAPFKSGGKTAGMLLVHKLAIAASCKDR
jgi:hypothetical protein